MAVYNDDFTNTDGTLLATHNANWGGSNVGNIQIQSNRAAPTSSGHAIYSGGTFTDDQYSKADLHGLSATVDVILVTRYVGASTMYRASFETDRVRILKINSGTTVIADNTSAVIADGATCEFRAVGDQLTCWADGVLVASATDSDITTGKPGFYFGAATGSRRVDNWEGGDYVAATPVKGVRVRLYDGSTEQESLTGLTAVFWDENTPHTFAAPVTVTNTATTDADGWLELDIDADTALAIDDVGFLMVYKAGATAPDDLVFASRIAVVDIA